MNENVCYFSSFFSKLDYLQTRNILDVVSDEGYKF